MADHHGLPLIGYSLPSFGNDDLRRRSSPDPQYHSSPHYFLYPTAPALRPSFYNDTLAFQAKYDGEHPTLQQATPNPMVAQCYPFRPLSSPPLALTRAPSPLKVDTDPFLPTPTVISGNVDASKYERVPYDEWMNGAPEYLGSSPVETDSVDSHSSFAHVSPGPCVFTPGSLDAAVAELEELEDPYLKNSYCLPHPAVERELCDPGRPASKEQVDLPDYLSEAAAAEYGAEKSNEGEEENIELSTAGSSSESDEEDRPDDSQDRNRRLLDMRERGMSYKDIKRFGNFSEAESTLRGRVRMLTKQKHERVRRPQWTSQDCTLLRRGVRHFVRQAGSQGRSRSRKLPWKRISEWMQEHGCSYFFAPATCAKKYEELR